MPSKRRRYKRQGRGRGQKRKKNKRRNFRDMNIEKEEEQFQIQREKALKEHEEQRLEEIDLGQSAALQRAKASQKKVSTAVITNLPFEISATELVKWLMRTCDLEEAATASGSNSNGVVDPSDSPFLSCDILKHKKGARKGKSSGRALIHMLKTSYNQLEAINQTTGLRLRGRRLKFLKGYQSRDQRDLHTSSSSFTLSSVLVGHPLETDSKSNPSSSSIIPYWNNTTSKKMELVFHERDRRQLTIQVGKNLRFEFDLHHLAQLRIGVNNDRKRTILLHFRSPPHCFRLKSDKSNSEETQSKDQELAAFFFHGVQDLDIYKDSFHWDASEEMGIKNDRAQFIRTIDPKKTTFSQCRTYQLVFKSSVRSREDNSLLRCFRDFSIKSTPDSSVFTQSSDSYPPSFDPKHVWCGGFFKFFAGFDFSTRYLLHCMLSNSYLIIPSSIWGIQLAHAIRQAGTDISNEVLEYFIAARFATSCKSVIEEIQEQYIDNDGRSYSDLSEHDDYDSDDEFDGEDDLQEIVVQRVLVTPVRVCPQLPTFEQSNRIIRKFHRHADRFLRVSFVEENFGSVLHALSDDIVEERLRSIMHHGIYVGGERFIFLHYSSSQLRDQSCWFYNDSPSSCTASPAPKISDVRAFMGREDCHAIKVIGKHAARMGQGFSTSVPTTSIKPDQRRVIKDVERNGFCFSDGVGTMSPHLAEEVAAKLELNNMVPSAFQIRIGGAKGVVSVYDGTYFKRGSYVSWLALRPSMIKFETDTSNDLEVLSYARPMRSYLNRQIITVLSSLGIADDVFLSRLDDMILVLSNCLTSTAAALEFAVHSTDEHLVYEALSSGFDITRDRHLRHILKAQRNRFLLDLELKSKIYIPNGVNLLGILDESNTLEYGSVFFQYTDPTTKELVRLPAGTRVAVCRSPCIHPGDIRILTVSAASEEMEQWVNVVVFPQKGGRPHPDEMSGGDLDGDIYTIYYDKELVPRSSYPAMPVTPTSHLNKPKTTNTEYVESIEIANFFVDYLQNDNLGRIANAHLALADALDAGAKDKVCIEFAKLHSTAVDFAKTGIPAEFRPELVPKKYPDFMQNKLKEVYESKKALGKIYRKVNGLQELATTNLEDVSDDLVDKSLVLPGSEQYLEDAQITRLDYNQELFFIMRRFDLIDEQEVFSGFVKEFSSKMGSFNQRGNRQLQERLNREVSKLKREFREIFWSDLEKDDENLYEAMKKASAWYQVAYGENHKNLQVEGRRNQTRLISFPWVMSDLLCKIKLLSS